MELVFSPEAAARAGSEQELWYHPLARWALAALLHRCEVNLHSTNRITHTHRSSITLQSQNLKLLTFEMELFLVVLHCTWQHSGRYL